MNMMRKMKMKGGALFGLLVFVLIASCIGAWITHIVYCLTSERWGFLIAGAILFPIAVVHGFLIWLGLV